MKKIAAGMTLVALVALERPAPVSAAGLVGVDAGAMTPHGHLANDAVDIGGFVSPYVGYMMNDNLGLLGRVEVWGANSDHGQDNEYQIVGLAGPRLALPMGPVELWAVFLGGASRQLTGQFGLGDNAWAIAPGAGLNFYLDEHWFVSLAGHWHRLYQRVHGFDDATYTTAGLGVGYEWGRAGEELPMPPPPPAPPAMAEAPPPPPPAPAPPVAKKKIVLRGVNFDFDRSEIRADAKPVLDAAIQTLKEEGGVAVIAEGHTDAVGSDEYNQKLSMRRANAVRDYLVAGGVSASRIRVEAYGESRPVATNDTEDGRAQNRRTELRVSEN